MVYIALKILHFLYPPLCLHCHKGTESQRHLLCASCLELLSLLDPCHRCPYCFKSVEGRMVCHACAALPVVYKKCAGACEAQGPARTMLQLFQRGSLSLAHAMGSLMAMQVLKLNWPLPDLILPLSESYFQKVKHGSDRNFLLARAIGEILNCPVSNLLKRSFNFSCLLEKEMKTFRFQLYPNNFSSCLGICDKRLLLVTDAFDRETIRSAVEVLRDGFPLETYVICFAIQE
jgi:competence protein ComFC